MRRGDWTSPDAYEELRSLDAPGFAWEYLDRNPDFAQDRRRLERAARRGKLDQVDADEFARRWGVRFCAGRERCALDTACPAKCGTSDATSG